MNYAMKKNDLSIVEKATNTVVAFTTTEEDLRKLHKHLNQGGGFNGVTPAFFMVPNTITVRYGENVLSKPD